MPQRFLRPGITTSVRFNSLSHFAQSLYIRILTLVDDYGRFEAHPTLLKSLAFPLNPEITCEQMSAACEHLLSAGMVGFYEVEGVKYLQVARWQERQRTKSKYPEPPADICKQLPANDNKCSPPSPATAPTPATAAGDHPAREEFSTYMQEHAGISDEYARARWGRYDSAGWVNGSGIPIRKWQSLAPTLQKDFRDELGRTNSGRQGPNAPARSSQKPNYETDEMKELARLKKEGKIG